MNAVSLAWAPIDLTPDAGNPAYKGTTGKSAPYPPPYYANTGAWGVRLAPPVIALDVDHYDGKTGADIVAKLVAELGPLPATYKITSRGLDEPGGKLLYRVPVGLDWHDPHEHVQILHHGWRYIAMGMHRKTKTRVELFHPDGYVVDPVTRSPAVRELPDLPPAWVARYGSPLRAGQKGTPDTNPDEPPNPALAPCAPAGGIGSRTASEDYPGGLLGYAKDLRKAGAGQAAIAEALHEVARDDDPGRPWTDADLEKLASEAVATAPVDVLAGADLSRAGAAIVPVGIGGYNQPPTGVALPVAGVPAGKRLSVAWTSAMGIEPVSWLWPGYLPHGGLCLLAGYEGDGKSTVAAWITARVTTGGFGGKPAVVLMVATEDQWKNTVVPRLMAAGADLAKVGKVIAETGELTLPDDAAALEELIIEHGAALVVLDPLGSRLADRYDTHKDAEVRRALEPLDAVLERTGATALGLMHWSKNGAGNPLDKLMGSRAFSALSRSTLITAPHPEDEDLRVLAHAKCNVGPRGAAMPYQVESAAMSGTAGGLVTTGCIAFLAPLEQFSLTSAFDKPPRRRNDANAATEEAAEWLSKYLAERDGVAPAADLKRAATEHGISPTALNRGRAMSRVGVSPVLGRPSAWAWHHEGIGAGDIALTLDHREKLAAREALGG